MSEGGWNPEKARIFKDQYLEFRHYVQINSKDLGGGAVLADHTFLSQKMLIDAVFSGLEEDIHDIKVLKSRQLGISTETRALSLFWLGVHPGLQGALVYDSDENKSAARVDVESVINSLPQKLKFPRIKTNNRAGLVLSNGSRISLKAAGTRANRSGGGLGRSLGINFAHCSEMCSWENTEGVVSFQQSLSEVYPDRLYIWESTARGPGLWNDMWNDARQDYSNQKALFLGWWAKDTQKLDKNSRAFHQYGLAPPTPEEQKRIDTVRDLYGVTVTQEQLAWYRRKMDPNSDGADDEKEKREGDDYKQAEQPWTEHEAFITAGSTFFSPERLTEIRSKETSNKYKSFRYYPGTDFVTCHVESARTFRETQLKVWEEPVHDAVYVIACDPAFGHDEANDRSCIEVMRAYADCIEQVAEFSDSLTPTNHLAWIIWSLIGWYGGGPAGESTNPIHTIIELNGPGDAVWLEFKNVSNIVKNGYLRGPAREKGLTNIFSNVRNFVYTRSDSASVGSAYHWKCLALDTPLPTPGGWTTIRDVKTGDVLFDETGSPCNVLGTSEIKYGHKCYRVKLEDGSSIVADHEHLWLAAKRANKCKAREGIFRTWELNGASIRISDKLALEDRDLPIHPYVLGVWLGDGHSATNRISSHIDDAQLFTGVMNEFGFSTTTPKKEKGERKTAYWAIPGLKKALRDCDLLNNKHIPKEYLRASIHQREELLRGLMDTDGSIDKNRQCSFTTTNSLLAHGFTELLRTLGIKAKSVKRTRTIKYKNDNVECAPAWQFWFTAPSDFCVFRLPRKNKRQNLKNNFQLRTRSKRQLISVEEAPSVPVRCIMVDSPSHLFLAGEAMLPTHNTTSPLKVSIMERLRGYTLDGSLIIRSQDALDEMKQVTRTGDDIRAQGHKKDDKVMTLAMACRAWDDRARKGLIATNRTKKADQALRALTIRDQFQIFSQNALQDFFKTKARARLSAAREARHRGWRG